jgi:nucleotide-binding universal stress UspA family protein
LTSPFQSAEMAHSTGGTPHIVSVFGPKAYAEGSRPAEFKQVNSDGEVEALSQSLSFIAKNRGVAVEVRPVKGAPADVLIKAADELNADHVLVGNQGMKGVRWVLGSVPNSVPHGVNCSVAVIDLTE